MRPLGEMLQMFVVGPASTESDEEQTLENSSIGVTGRFATRSVAGSYRNHQNVSGPGTVGI